MGVLIWLDWLARAPGKHRSFLGLLYHLGAFGLFGLAILDSMPLPTFSGADILTALLAARHRAPWYEYAAAATSGSVLGAFLTFRLARKAGLTYLNKRFGQSRVSAVSRLLERWGTPALAISAGVPFPTPTTVFFAAAGASNYSMRRYLLVVGIARALRFSLVAFLAARYGREFLRAVRHPAESWGWLLLLAALIAVGVAGVTLMNRRMASASHPKP
jgi:membrane protein YqaA with SNARE-associated domain